MAFPVNSYRLIKQIGTLCRSAVTIRAAVVSFHGGEQAARRKPLDGGGWAHQSAGHTLAFQEPAMTLTPLIAVHMTAALLALVTGPVALWARKGSRQRPRLHRAFGYAWVAFMLLTAGSALFIRDFRLPNVAGFTFIHLLVPITFGTLFVAFRALAQGHLRRHRMAMQRLYVSACVVAGALTLLPNRLLGTWLWGQCLGWL